jgi:hypothetical protein
MRFKEDALQPEPPRKGPDGYLLHKARAARYLQESTGPIRAVPAFGVLNLADDFFRA